MKKGLAKAKQRIRKDVMLRSLPKTTVARFKAILTLQGKHMNAVIEEYMNDYINKHGDLLKGNS